VAVGGTMIRISQQVGRTLLVESRNELTHGDLFLIREAARAARKTAEAALIMILALPHGVLARGHSFLETLADSMQLPASDAQAMYLVVEDPDVRDALSALLAASARVPQQRVKITLFQSLDDAFRAARQLAHRDVLEIQRTGRQSSEPGRITFPSGSYPRANATLTHVERKATS
jgi:hypothetical protein